MSPASQAVTPQDFLYATERRFFALLGEGLEEMGAQELASLGASEVQPGYRGLYFEAGPEALYRVLYGARLFSRVLAPLMRFDCHSPKYLYRRAGDLAWESLYSPDQTFAIQAVCSNSTMHHSGHAALTLKDAIVDRFRTVFGRRPSVDSDEPDAAIHLYIHSNRATISLDLSGGSLHRRGYRRDAVTAPMQETLAAGVIRATGWTGLRPLTDPFCGSGTLLCEAWMAACGIPAGFLRTRFALERLPDYDAALWRRVREDMDGRIAVPPGISVSGSDIDPEAVRASRANLDRLPEGGQVELSCQPFERLGGWNDHVIVTNPPYGVRLGDRQEAEALVGRFGDFLKQRCAGCEAFVYFGDNAMVKKLGLKPSWRKNLFNGGLDGRLCRYELFAGPADQRRKQEGL